MNTRASGGLCGALLAAFATTLFLAWLASRSTLWDRDEPRFAQATVEMLASRDWLVPTFNGELRADKPALIYWLMSVPLRVLGASAWSARLVSACALGVASLATFAAARRAYGVRAGHWSQLLLALAPLALVEGSLATTDATLLACLACAFAVWMDAALGEWRVRHVVLLAASCGAAQLAKGPVALALVAASITTALVLAKRRGVPVARHARGAALACGLGTLVFLAWAIPANAATDGEFLRRGIGHHVLERAARPLEGHGPGFVAGLPYYLPIVLFGCAPASALLLVAWTRWRASTSLAAVQLIAWSAPCFVLMTLVGTKLPHYVLPVAPALAVAGARVLTAPRAESVRVRRATAVLLALALAVPAAAFAAAPFALHLAELRVSAWGASACVLAALVFGVRATWRGAFVRGTACACAGLAAAYVVLGAALLPVVERAKLAPRLAALVRAAAPSDVPIERFGYVEPSLDFDAGRVPIHTLADEAELRAWFAARGASVLVVSRDRLARAGLVATPPSVREAGSTHGLSTTQSTPREIVVLVRDPR